MRKFRPGFLSENNLRSGPRRKFPMAADEVRMQMTLDDVFDFEILSAGFLNVLVDIALRIDYDSFTVGTNQVGSVSQATEIELLEIHFLRIVMQILHLDSLANFCGSQS